MNLLLIVPWMRLGGADRFNLSLARHLPLRGVKLALCATISGEHPWTSAFAKYLPDITVLPPALHAEDYPRLLLDLIESQKIEVVLISHSMLGYAVLPYLRSACPNVTFVDYNHMVATVWRSGGFARVGVNYQPRLDLNLVSSEQVKAWMVRQGAEAGRIAVCYTNIDTAEWDPSRYDRNALRQTWNLPADIPVILYPARLEPQKRPRLVAEILKRLHQKGQRFICLVAGGGSQRQWLEHYLGRYGLQGCARLLGSVAPDRMPELNRISDILLLPSRDEGISLALYEAMAMRVVPVCADVGGQRELVTPEAGFLIPQGYDEPGTYVDVVTQLLEQDDLRARIGQAARQRIGAHFTIDQMADRMMSLLEQAQGLTRTAPRTSVSRDEGAAIAAQVVEDARLERLQETLRVVDWSAPARYESRPVRLWRTAAYQIKKRVLRPVYEWGLRNGPEWIEQFANQVYRALHWMLR